MKQTRFILKVLIISAGLSVLIKYAGPILYIPATAINALIAVFVPTFIVAIALLWRAYSHQQPNSASKRV